jgi:hypothetical protein
LFPALVSSPVLLNSSLECCRYANLLGNINNTVFGKLYKYFQQYTYEIKEKKRNVLVVIEVVVVAVEAAAAAVVVVEIIAE